MPNEEGNPTLNDAMNAEKHACSRAVLTYTDAVALLQGSTSDIVDLTRFASAAERISQIKLSRLNQSAYASAQKQRARRGKTEGGARTDVKNFSARAAAGAAEHNLIAELSCPCTRRRTASKSTCRRLRP
jgi:hypothetical protein